MTSLQSSTSARHAAPVRPLRLALLGTTAPDDRFEAAAVEIGRRLVRHGHEVTIYGQAVDQQATRERPNLRRVSLPALPVRGLEAISRCALEAAHLSATRRHDVAIVFGAGNAPLVPLMRARGTAVALHVGTLEWKRQAHGRTGRRYFRMAEQAAAREADALIADSRTMQAYFDEEFAVPAEYIGYGTTILRHTPSDLLEQLDLVPGAFHLVISGFEREDHVEVVVEGYHRSQARLPLVIVGSPASPSGPAQQVVAVAERDDRIRLLGADRDPRLLDQLYAHAVSYLHGHSLGGTHPSLLRAMGAGTPVLAWDVAFNREVAGTGASYFDRVPQLSRQVEEVERYPMRFIDLGQLMQERARARYDWNQVSEAYEALAAKLARGYSIRGMSTGRRLDSAWSRPEEAARG